MERLAFQRRQGILIVLKNSVHHIMHVDSWVYIVLINSHLFAIQSEEESKKEPMAKLLEMMKVRILP